MSIPPNDKQDGHLVYYPNGKAEILRHYTDAQWQRIDKSLAAIDIDLVNLTVGGPFSPDKQWWLSPFWRRPLYAALEEMAWSYKRQSRGQRVTPLQEAERLKSALETFQSARESLNDYPHAIAEKLVADSAINRAEAALTELIDRGQRRLPELIAMGSASNKNAKKVQNLYWLELMRLWQAIATPTTKHKHKHLSEFLFACSEPIFPDTTHSAITAFVERHFRK